MKADKKKLLPVAFMTIVSGLTVFALGFGPAYADGKAEICPQCNQDGTWSVPSGGAAPGPSNGPSGPSPEQIRRSERDRLNDLGSAAKERGDLAAAIEYYRQALQSSPADETVRRDLGFVQNDQAIRIAERGDYAAAVRLLEEALQNRPDDDVIRRNLAAYRSELDRRRQLDDAKRVIGGMLDNLAEEWDASGASNAPGGLDFADPGGAVAAPGGLDFMAPAAPRIAPANQDSSVVDLTFLDPNGPMVVEPRIVKGQGAAGGPSPARAVELRDAVKAAEGSGGVRKTEILLDALEIGRANWNASLSYLEDARRKYPDDLAVRDAMATLLGIASFFDDSGSSINFGADMLGRFDDDTGLDYETWALLRRATAKFSTARTASDWEVVHRLFAQAREKSPDQLRVRDWVNFTEGMIVALQQFE